MEIPLTQGYAALIDDDEIERVLPYLWRTINNNGILYAGTGGRSPLFMHRFIMNLPYGSSEPQVDHINLNGLDNRKSNLRIATRSQNMANRLKPVGGTSRFKGVGWDSSRSKWRAQIMVMYENKFLGRFTDEEDAARAYDEAAREYFGEFARTNF